MPPLPEEFAPTGPKLSRFPVRPAPPVRPRLFADEARFALRLALLAGGAELAAWAWIVGAGGKLAALVAVLRLTRFAWGALGTRVSRALIAFSLLFVALLVQGLGLPSVAALACGLCAPAELCATAVADAVTVERRAAAFGWLDVGQSLGVALGLGLGLALPAYVPAIAAAALFVAGVGVADLRDRGTPRSTWPPSLFVEALRTPIGARLCAMAFAGALAGLFAARVAYGFWPGALLLAGMGLAARVEPRMPNALVLPQALAAAAVVAGLAVLAAPVTAAVAIFALGALASVLPASVARAAAEMQRAPTSALIWSALALGAAVSRAVL